MSCKSISQPLCTCCTVMCECVMWRVFILTLCVGRSCQQQQQQLSSQWECRTHDTAAVTAVSANTCRVQCVGILGFAGLLPCRIRSENTGVRGIISVNWLNSIWLPCPDYRPLDIGGHLADDENDDEGDVALITGILNNIRHFFQTFHEFHEVQITFSGSGLTKQIKDFHSCYLSFSNFLLFF